MDYQLIVTEKPQAALKVAYALADGNPVKKIVRGVSYFELSHRGMHIIVASTVGHIFALKEKDKKGWTYPVFNMEWAPSYEVSKHAAFTKKYFTILKKLASGATSFVGACDLDTEGELIFRNILRFLFKKEDAQRMRFSTLTKEDLVNAYENVSQHIDFNLAEAGETRHFLDFLWGINTTRALTLAMKAARGGFQVLSSGRVQSPTLALLAKREEEIESFNPVPYWQLLAHILVDKTILEALHKEDKFFGEKKAKEIYKKCLGKDAKVSKIIKRVYRSLPPVPFNITSLQTEAYNLFGFSPSQTSQIAESLYLAAFISYPRTSSEKLPSKIGWKQILNALSEIKEFEAGVKQLLEKNILKANEGKKEDPAHVAIYPTSSPPKNLNELNEQQRKLYDLIVKRFLAVFGDAAERESLEVDFDIAGEIFIVRGARTLKAGWLALYEPYVRLKEVQLPSMKEGEIYKVKKLDLKEDETKPSSRYNQGSIVAEMEKRGLGTKATRAEILQTLYDRQYIDGKAIVVTELGKKIIKVLEKNVPDLVSEQLTRHFEEDMERVQIAEKKEGEILEEAKIILEKMLKKFKEKENDIGKELAEAFMATKKAQDIIGVCPSCGKNLKIIVSRATRKRFIGCEGYSEGCRVSFPLPQVGLIRAAKQKCKTCGSPIVLVYTKGRRPWILCINPACESKKAKSES